MNFQNLNFEYVEPPRKSIPSTSFSFALSSPCIHLHLQQTLPSSLPLAHLRLYCRTSRSLASWYSRYKCKFDLHIINSHRSLSWPNSQHRACFIGVHIHITSTSRRPPGSESFFILRIPLFIRDLRIRTPSRTPSASSHNGKPNRPGLAAPTATKIYPRAAASHSSTRKRPPKSSDPNGWKTSRGVPRSAGP